MNRSKLAITLTLLSFLVLLVVALIVRAPSTSTKLPVPVQLDQQSSPSAAENAAPETISYNCEAGKSALELLRKKVADSLEVKTYSIGAMVESINGVKGGTGNKYWLYFVDGKSATVSADTYHCQDREPVEWRFTDASGM